MIAARGLHKIRGGRELFGGLDLEVARGETCALVGPSGAGKTTLLALLGGLLAADQGTIALEGQPWAGLSPAQRARRRAERIGFVFQEGNLLPHLTVEENLRLPELFGGPRAAPADALRMLEAVGLRDKGRTPARQLSGGEAHRAAVARALLRKPVVLLCDEPTGSLDAAAAAQVGRLLVEAARDLGCAAVMASHDAQLVGLCGRRVSIGSPQAAAASAPSRGERA